MIIRPGRQGRRAGLGTVRGAEYGALARGSLFSPLQQPTNLVGWFRGDKGITLGATPLASGTTPPAVTLSGTLAQSLGLYIRIDGAGILGTATFKWSVDNGVNFVATGVLTGASVVLGTTGITAAFAAGAYATDNIYQVTVAAWADSSAAGNTVTQATAALQPLFTTAVTNNRPGITCAASLLSRINTNLFGSGAYTYTVVNKWTVASNRAMLGNTDAATTSGEFLGSIGTNRRDTHPGQFDANDGALTTNQEIWLVRRGAGAAPTLRVNGVSTSMAGAGSGLSDPGGAAILHVGSSSVGGTPFPGSISEIVLYTAAITDTLTLQLEAYLRSRYGI